MNIGLIAEGASELRVLKHILGRYLGTEYVLNEIQPKTNHGTQETEGGWHRVITTFETENKVKEALVENDYVLIQIDTDMAEISPFDVSTKNEDGTACSAEELLQRVSERILNHIPALDEAQKGRIILAICINEIECWLLPLVYAASEAQRCKTQGCVTTLNRRLVRNNMDAIAENKNSPQSQRAYKKLLKLMKKESQILACTDCDNGFCQFIDQLKAIKDSEIA